MATTNRPVPASGGNPPLHRREAAPEGRHRPIRVNRGLEVAGAYAWRLIVVAVVVMGALWLVRRLWVVLVALLVALMLTRVLAGPARWLRGRGLPPALSALVSLLGLLLVLVGIGALIVPATTSEFDELGSTVSGSIDDVEDWLVNDAPFDISQRQLQDLRAEAGDRVGQWARSSSGTLVSGAIVALEVVAALLLALITTFFLLKDGERFQRLLVRSAPEDKREVTAAMGSRAWSTLGGYLRGAALLGIVEAAILGVTLWILGASLVIPVMVITVLGAFVPFVGAIVSGLIAVLVALASAGFGGAVIVAVVALVVQQLDNDLLAPVIYGKALQLHPLLIVFSITAAGALFGPAGAVLAVPVVAVVINVVGEYHTARGEDLEPSEQLLTDEG